MPYIPSYYTPSKHTKPMKPFISYTLLPLLVLILLPIHEANGQKLIQNICKSFAQKDPNIKNSFCTSSLLGAPASQCATLRGLGTISIRLVRYNLTDTRCYIRRLMLEKKWDLYVKRSLKDCYDLYSDALPTVKQAMKDYKSKHFLDANVHISSVMDAATTCEDGFRERKGVVSPLTSRNNDVFQLSAVSLSIMNMLQTRED